MKRINAVGFLGILLAGLLLAGPAFARQPFGKKGPGHEPGAFFEQNADEIGIDEETLGEIKKIVGGSREEAEAFHSRLREARAGMRDLLESDTPDESAVMEQVERLGEIQIEMRKHRLQTMLRIRALLTPEQREALRKITKEHKPGKRLRALIEACGPDVERLCSDVERGRARLRCLHENRSELSEQCRSEIEALPQRGRRHGGNF